MRVGASRPGRVVSCLVTACLLVALAPIPAMGVVPAVPGLASSTHPDQDAWYADDAPAFSWDAASDLPRLLGTLSLPGSGQGYAVAVDGDRVYVANGTAGLRIVDVSHPDAPVLLGTYDAADVRVCDVAVAGDLAYITCADDFGSQEYVLRVLDVSDPAAPVVIGSCETSDAPSSVAVSGDVAYVAVDGYGVCTIDVSDPATPVLLGSSGSEVGLGGITVEGTTVYAAIHDQGLLVIDAADPASPTVVGTSGPFHGEHVAVEGDVAYVAAGGSGLKTVDVSDPTAPVVIGSCGPERIGGAVGEIEVQGGTAYVRVEDADPTTVPSQYGLAAVDVSDPADPTPLGAYVTPGIGLGLAVAGDIAYLVDGGSTLHVVRVSDFDTPTVRGEYPMPDGSYDVACAGRTVYLAGGASAGLQVVDVSDPASPALVGSYDTPGGAVGVAVSGNTVYIADGASGLQVVDVSDPTAPELVGSSEGVGWARKLAVAGTTVYVADVSGALHIVDARDPAAPVLVGSCATAGAALNVAVAGTTAYVAAESAGLQVIDVSDPASPSLLGSYDTPGSAGGVAVSGSTAYIADYASGSGLKIIDVSDPTAPALLGSCDIAYPLAVAVAGTTAYVDGPAGLRVIDVSDPTAPAVLGTLDLPGQALNPAVAGATVYAADEITGLKIINVGHGPVAYSWVLNHAADTVPDVGGASPGLAAAFADVADGEWYFHVRAVAEGRRGGESAHLRVRIDTTAPTNPIMTSASHTPGVWSNTSYISVTVSGAADVGSGVDGYSTHWGGTEGTPDATKDWEEMVTFFGSGPGGEGARYFNLRTVDNLGHWSDAVHSGPYLIDLSDPVTTDDAVASYDLGAAIALQATDAYSGVDETWYSLDGGPQQAYSVPIEVPVLGAHTLEYWSVDVAGNVEGHQLVDFEVTRSGPVEVVPVEGDDRFETAAEVSRASFPSGAQTVVIVTGSNWPDALGGAALAGAHDAPILLTAPRSLPAVTAAEIGRLGATKAIILGGEAAVGPAVQTGLVAAGVPAGGISRIGGVDRYDTARKAAQATIAELGADFDGTVFVATGLTYPDALAASPLAAANGWPIYLAGGTAAPATLAGAMAADGATDALVLGGDTVVSPEHERALDAALGDVERLAGGDRYATAAAVADYGVKHAGLAWNGVAIATGEDFPDALAGGVLCARSGTVMLLTRSATLSAPVATSLAANRGAIATVRFLGGENAVAPSVRAAVERLLEQ